MSVRRKTQQKKKKNLVWEGSCLICYLLVYFSVLNKVSKYRGVNRDKNDLNAATWFTQPGNNNNVIFDDVSNHRKCETENIH